MIQVPYNIPKGPMEVVDLQVEDTDIDFEKAKGLAKQKAGEMHGEAMLLSWHNSQSGEYYPTYECGGSEQPAWILYAESRGANLTIRINGGIYTFMFIGLMPSLPP